MGRRELMETQQEPKKKAGVCAGWKSPPSQEIDLLSMLDELVGWATSHCKSNNNSSTKAISETCEHERTLGLSYIPAAPPPPSHIKYLHGCMSERLSGATGARKTRKKPHQFDASGHVAVGMAIEEVLTMTLMPLAEEHVKRCRRLEQQKDRKRPTDTVDPFHLWTLPLTEAIVQLAKDGGILNQDALVRKCFSAAHNFDRCHVENGFF